MAIDPPYRFDPYRRIVDVGWPSGYFALVTVQATYRLGTPGTRTGVLELTDVARAAGGKILGQRTFQVVGSGLTKTVYRALMQFARIPNNSTNVPAFKVALTGSIVVDDTSNPPPSVDYFCGTTTVHYHRDRFLQHIPPGQTQVMETFSWSIVTPAGTSTGSMTYQLADVVPDDVTHPPSDQDASSNSIWYVDHNGNYVDTHRPCSELQPPGAVIHSQYTEGFDFIEIEIFPKKNHDFEPVDDWLFNIPGTFIVFPTTGDDGDFGYAFAANVPHTYTGNNADHQPVFNDLPDGVYEFKINTMKFSDPDLPPDGSPIGKIGPTYSTIGVYPIAPAFANYNISVGVFKPKPATPRKPPQVGSPPMDALFLVGVIPASSTEFA